MGTVHSLQEFKNKKELEEERKIARELQHLLSEIMIDDEPLIISYEDSDGNLRSYTLDQLYDLSDSNL